MAHGEWEQWCVDSLGMSRSNAHKIIKVSERFENVSPVKQLPTAMSVLYELAPFTDEELTQPIPQDDGETKTLLEMSRREVAEYKRKQGSSEGTFMAWYQSLGFSSMQVSRFIQRFELLTLCEEPVREILEELPVTLTYEIAKPSAESTIAKSQAKAPIYRHSAI